LEAQGTQTREHVLEAEQLRVRRRTESSQQLAVRASGQKRVPREPLRQRMLEASTRSCATAAHAELLLAAARLYQSRSVGLHAERGHELPQWEQVVRERVAEVAGEVRVEQQ